VLSVVILRQAQDDKPQRTRRNTAQRAQRKRGKVLTFVKQNKVRKLIAAINMTLDGFFDHTALIADDEIHQHYTDLLNSGGTVLYGRITYQLMEYWRTVLENPTGNKSTDEFAVAMDNIPKVVFSPYAEKSYMENCKAGNERH
jgi:hypothetical protein